MSETAIDLDSLDASLDDLMKAADAADVKDRLMKSVRGEHPKTTETHREDPTHVEPGRGDVGGGMASMSDAGPLDDLMIGKMIASGVPASVVSDFVAYMSDEEDDGDEDEDDMDEYEKGGWSGDEEPLAKSHFDELREDSDIGPGVDASPFMEALTMRTAHSLDAMSKSLRTTASKQANFNTAMGGSVYQLGQLLKSQAAVIGELSKRLGIVERTPVAPRGVTGAAALEKSGFGAQTEKLTKSQACSTLSYMNLKKGMTKLNGRNTGELACMLEAGGSVDQATVQEIHHFLATHPAEADAAKNF